MTAWNEQDRRTRTSIIAALALGTMGLTVATVEATSTTTNNLDSAEGEDLLINGSGHDSVQVGAPVIMSDALTVHQALNANSLTPRNVGGSAAVDFTGGANTITLTASSGVTTSVLNATTAIKPTLLRDNSGATWLTLGSGIGTVAAGASIATNTIAETTAASGVTIDSVLCKDGRVSEFIGGSATAARGALTVRNSWVNAAPGTTAETAMDTYTIPAATFSGADKSRLRVTVWGVAAANTNSKIVRLRALTVGGSNMGQCTFAAAGDTVWEVVFDMMHFQANGMAVVAHCRGKATQNTVDDQGGGGITDSSTNDIIVTVTNATAASDLTVRGVTWEYLP